MLGDASHSFECDVRDELDGEHYETFVVDNGNGTSSDAYRSPKREAGMALNRTSTRSDANMGVSHI